MSDLPFGVDISSYQGRSIDYTLMKQNTKFVAVRAGISWGYEDPVFAQSWQALKGHNRIAYHVLYPSQDVTKQTDWLFDMLSRVGFDAETDRIAIDIELWQGQTPQRVTEATTQMYDQITQRTGRKPIIYSAAWFVNPRMVVTPKLAAADWWLANYPPKGSAPGTEHPGPPLLPRGVTKWLIHQTSETGIGRNFGLPSGAIDTNRWNGTLEDVQAYFGLTEQEPEPEPEPEPELVLYSPVPKGTRITQRFGMNPSWYPTSKGHNGIDYGTMVGTPITAMQSGTVEVSKEQVGGYGRHIRIRHEHGVSIYGHLSRRDVQVGDKVIAKQRIGLSGGNLEDPYAGFSTGAHLHAEYRQDKPVVPLVPGSYVYNAIDHLPFIKEEEEEEIPMLYQVEVTVYALNIRAGVGTRYPIIRTVLKGTILNVYAESQEWLRVGSGQWCSGDNRYVRKITPPSSDPTIDDKVNKLWEAHPELHE